MDKSCSFSLPCMSFVNFCQFLYMLSFSFDFEGGTCDLIDLFLILTYFFVLLSLILDVCENRSFRYSNDNNDVIMI